MIGMSYGVDLIVEWNPQCPSGITSRIFLPANDGGACPFGTSSSEIHLFRSSSLRSPGKNKKIKYAKICSETLQFTYSCNNTDA